MELPGGFATTMGKTVNILDAMKKEIKEHNDRLSPGKQINKTTNSVSTWSRHQSPEQYPPIDKPSYQLNQSMQVIARSSPRFVQRTINKYDNQINDSQAPIYEKLNLKTKKKSLADEKGPGRFHSIDAKK